MVALQAMQAAAALVQDTRLNNLIDSVGQQLGLFFSNPWRRTSLLVIALLLGVFLGTAIPTTTGQRSNLDVIVAAIALALTETANWWIYRRRPRGRAVRRSLGSETLNALKIGVTYGLFIEAFKLGS